MKTTPDKTSPQVAARAKDSRDDATAHKIVTILSRGNVSLQSGAYETEQDIGELRRSLANHKF